MSPPKEWILIHPPNSLSQRYLHQMSIFFDQGLPSQDGDVESEISKTPAIPKEIPLHCQTNWKCIETAVVTPEGRTKNKGTIWHCAFVCTREQTCTAILPLCIWICIMSLKEHWEWFNEGGWLISRPRLLNPWGWHWKEGGKSDRKHERESRDDLSAGVDSWSAHGARRDFSKTEWCHSVKCMLLCQVSHTEWHPNFMSRPYWAFNLNNNVDIQHHAVQWNKKRWERGKKKWRDKLKKKKCGPCFTIYFQTKVYWNKQCKTTCSIGTLSDPLVESWTLQHKETFKD